MHAALLATLIVAAPTVAFLAHRAVEHRSMVRATEVEALWQEVRLLGHGASYGAMLDRAHEILRIDPDHVEALRCTTLCGLYLAREIADPEEQSEVLDGCSSIPGCAELERTSVDALRRLVELHPEVSGYHRLAAWVLAEFGRSQEAEEQARLAELHRSEQPNDDDLELDALLAIDQGDDASAVELLTPLIGRRPHGTGLIVERARSYEKLGDPQAAILDYQRAAALTPDDAVARFNLGRLLTASGFLVEGNEHLRAAARLLPDEAVVREGLALNALSQAQEAARQGDVADSLELLDTAEREARTSLRLDDRRPRAHMHLGVVLAERYRLQTEPTPALIDEAIGHYEREIELWRSSPAADRDAAAYGMAISNLCDIHLQVGNLERGMQVCAEAVALRADDPNAHYNLAGAYALAGRRDEALAALDRDLELGDNDHEYLAADPWFESLHGDPGFEDLLRRMRAAANE